MNIFILRSAMSSLESCNDAIRYYNVREKRQNVVSLQICEDQWILFQENSMFKQFFGACNQLDWFVSEMLISAKADCEISIEKRGRFRKKDLQCGGSVKNFSVSELWPGLIRAMRACTKKERLEREKEARQEAAERVTRVRNKWESISMRRVIILTSSPYITDPWYYSSFNPRMANLKSDDWRENMKARMDQENAEKWDKYVAPKSPSFPFNIVPHPI